MLRTNTMKNITGQSMVEVDGMPRTIMSFNCSITSDTQKPNINSNIMDIELYKANKKECDKDFDEFVEYVESQM